MFCWPEITNTDGTWLHFYIYTHLLCGVFQVIVRKWDAQEERLIKLSEEEVIYQTLLEPLSYFLTYPIEQLIEKCEIVLLHDNGHFDQRNCICKRYQWIDVRCSGTVGRVICYQWCLQEALFMICFNYSYHVLLLTFLCILLLTLFYWNQIILAYIYLR